MFCFENHNWDIKDKLEKNDVDIWAKITPLTVVHKKDHKSLPLSFLRLPWNQHCVSLPVWPL